jgi:hypothetical protein
MYWSLAALRMTRPSDSKTIKQLQALAHNESYFDNLARESPMSPRYELTTQGIYQVDDASGTLIPVLGAQQPLTSPPARPGRWGSPARSTSPGTAAQPDFVYGGRICSNPNEKVVGGCLHKYKIPQSILLVLTSVAHPYSLRRFHLSDVVMYQYQQNRT